LIADLDKKSKSYAKDFWVSFLLEGDLFYYPSRRQLTVRFNSAKSMLKGTFSARKRGMELSELVTFNGRLLTCDDRTGLVYELRRQGTANESQSGDEFDLIPWVVMMDGDGTVSKPFKCEWLAVKDRHLYAGGLGKVWTTPDGHYVNNHPQWIKRIDTQGAVEHLDWSTNYDHIAEQVGIRSPGYVIHESAVWSERNNRWYFLPRKASKESYNEDADESRSTNLLIEASSDFRNVTHKEVGPLHPLHGFSSFKFLPDIDEEVIVAIKSMEYKDNISTFITAFTLNGDVLLPEQLVDNSMKFEGIEFV
jgi:soluble calcium-activated nucleotidase 1